MRREEVTMHEIDDERPIPLGRAAAATPSTVVAAEPEARPAEAAPPVVPTPPERRPDARTEKTRVKAREPATARPDHATPPAPPPIAVAEPPVDLQPATATPASAPAAAEHAPNEHPLAGLRGFRMDVEIVGPALPVRDLGRFLAAYVVVAAFVLGLIVAFLALTAHV